MINNFSKLTTEEKIECLIQNYHLPSHSKKILLNHHHNELQDLYNQFSENTISNFYLPFGVAPNFTINQKEYAIPMAIEESSVVAAASKAAKFWSKLGGFTSRVITTRKVGQLFFRVNWSYKSLNEILDLIKIHLNISTSNLTQSMTKRGGGITDMELSDESSIGNAIYCLTVSFETVDSMGANFINSCLEKMGDSLNMLLKTMNTDTRYETTMAILSNYNPQCIVECSVECHIENLSPYAGELSPHEFANKFETAINIANNNTHRAVTHNKGIMNGVDAVVIATGNDFRATEANAHAYAARNGKYSSLSNIEINQEIFKYNITLPLAVGTIGGLTKLHPMAKLALVLLGTPNAQELMQIIAAAGLANNFSAVAALITSGIQKGHMKMHLSNILNTFNASDDETLKAKAYFAFHNISYIAVRSFLELSRKATNK